MDENMCRRRAWRRVLALAAGWAVILGAVGPGAVEAAAPLGPWRPEQMALAGARVAWQVHLPMGYTASIKSYHLVDGYLYGIGTDGYVRAIRADTGEYVWTQKLAEPFDTIWPPVAARLEVVRKGAEDSSEEAGESETEEAEEGEAKAEEAVKETVDAVVFTLVRTAVFLDPKTGLELKQVRLGSSSNAAVAVSREHCFEVGPNRRLRCVSLADGVRKWHMATPAPIDLPPVYVARDDVVVVADSQGTVGGVTTDKTRQFTQSLGAKPIGWLAADGLAVYVATADKTLHAIDRASNRISWRYRLADPPAGGPAVTKAYVYQATIEGGLYCKHKSERLNWHNARAKCFLAEWPSRTAVLYPDGHIALLHPETGQAAELIDPGSAAEGVGNPWNDAVILASPKGRICCIRPVGAAQLTLADFRPAPPPAPESPAPPPEAGTDENDAEAVGAEAAAEPAAPEMETSKKLLLTDPLRSQRRIRP